MSVGIIQGNIASINVISVAFTPVAVGAATSAAQSITVPGVLVGDTVIVNKPTTTAGVSIGGATVSAANTVAVTYVNSTAGSLTPAAETYLFTVIRPESAGSSVKT